MAMGDFGGIANCRAAQIEEPRSGGDPPLAWGAYWGAAARFRTFYKYWYSFRRRAARNLRGIGGDSVYTGRNWQTKIEIPDRFCFGMLRKKGILMKLSKLNQLAGGIVSLTFALLFNMNVASAQRVIGNGILDYPGYPNSPYMYSGNYWSIGGNPSSLPDTALPDIQPAAYTLSFPTTTLPGPGGSWTCNDTNYMTNTQTFIESTQGAGITGFKILGSFNNKTGPITDLTPAQNLFETVFFNENQCYTAGTALNPSREYGFFLTTTNNQIWAYWSTYTNNQTDVSGVQFPIPTVSANTPYYFEIYPVLNNVEEGIDFPNGCGFQIYVWNTSGQLLSGYPFSLDVDGATSSSPQGSLPSGGAAYGIGVTSRDGGFCSAIQADTGYISANITNPYNVSGSIPSPATFNLYLYAVAVGGL
jgi:hypothetical protein